ncbi:MAG: ankyrin repeat domain-containing protein [Planctomycetes bacterium]|nr:ankyrin repeat domain-containing protein [Planctomycetota bacterium]
MRAAIERDNEKTLESLLAAGEDPNCVNGPSQWSATQYAAAQKEGKCLDVLIRYGADVNQRNKNDGTALMTALAEKNDRNLRRLLEAGAKQRGIASNDATALSMAGFQGSVECARILLEFGADPMELDGEGRTALHAAAGSPSGGSTEVLRLLLAHLPNREAVDVQNSTGRTPLEAAVVVGNADAVEVLIAAGANVAGEGSIAFSFAALKNDVRVLNVLLAAGADPNAHTASLQTPLHLAAREGASDALAVLLKAGAKPNAQDDTGDTPLHEAAESRRPSFGKEAVIECVKLLLKHGADRTIKNKDGQTPLDVAYWLDVEMLLKDDGEA